MRRAPLALALALSGCGATTDAGLIAVSGPITGARHFYLTLGTADGVHHDSFSVPDKELNNIVLPRTISFTFPDSVQGTLDVHVDALSGFDTLGSGDGSAPILHGGVTEVKVVLSPEVPVDGGAPDLSMPPDLAPTGDLVAAPPVDGAPRG